MDVFCDYLKFEAEYEILKGIWLTSPSLQQPPSSWHHQVPRKFTLDYKANDQNNADHNSTPQWCVLTSFCLEKKLLKYSKAFRCTFLGEWKNSCSSKFVQLELLNKAKARTSKNRAALGFYYINSYISNFFEPYSKMCIVKFRAA